MPFEFRKISNVGASHPVMARLGVQSGQILKWLDAKEEVRDELVSLYALTLTERLLRCHEHRATLQSRLDESVAAIRPQKDPRVREAPHVPGLQSLAEDFLYEVKRFLRDLLKVFELLYGFKPQSGASDFADMRGQGSGHLGQWALGKFGTNDAMARSLVAESAWVTELVKMRNAVEHPGGQSGTLTISNCRIDPASGRWIRPTWQRTGRPETCILGDMDVATDDLLTLAEEILVSVVMRQRTFQQFTVYQVPEAKRDPACPVRFVMDLEPAFAAQLTNETPKAEG